MDKPTAIAAFVKFNRDKLNLTQQMLAGRTGVGIHFIRDMEQGKPSLRLDKVDMVLTFFGFRLAPVAEQIDPYQLWYTYKDKAVEILLKDKRKTTGFLVGEIRGDRGMIASWKLVPVPDILEWNAGRISKTDIITHAEIEKIDLLKHEQIR